MDNSNSYEDCDYFSNYNEVDVDSYDENYGLSDDDGDFAYGGVEEDDNGDYVTLDRLGAVSGFDILGADLLDLLPVLVWLNRWVHESVSSAGSILDVSTSSISKTHSLMRVHVPLPLVVNSMWLLKNVYCPWTTKSQPAKKQESNLQDVTLRYGLVLHDDSVAHTSSSHAGNQQHLATEVPSSHDVITTSLHLSHLTDNSGPVSEGAPEQENAGTPDEVPSIVVQSPTSDETTFTLGRVMAGGRRNKQKNKSLGNHNDSADSETGLQ